jgi:hypothetical protein
LELRPHFNRPPGFGGQGNGGTGGRRGGGGGGFPGGGGGFGGPGGGPGGPSGPGGPGGPEGGPPGGGPPIESGTVTGQSDAQRTPSPEQQAARQAFQNSPEVKAYRAFIGCSYVTILKADEAKAKGIVLTNARPGLFYVPGIGITFIEPPELPQGGGSLRSIGTPASEASPSPSPAPSASPTP